MDTETALSVVMRLLQLKAFNYVDEKVCQREMEAFFREKGLQFEREYNFGTGIGVCDFFFPRSGLVLEAKAFKNWSKKQVYRQCERYCGQSQVTGLLLATGKAQGLPRTIAGKPVRVYQLGLGAL